MNRVALLAQGAIERGAEKSDLTRLGSLRFGAFSWSVGSIGENLGHQLLCK